MTSNNSDIRKFKNPEDLLVYSKELYEEESRIKEAQKRRPLRENDQMFRNFTAIDGMSFLYSIVIRTDGSIEFWMKRFFVDEDESLQDTTQKTFTLAAHLRRKELTDRRSEP